MNIQAALVRSILEQWRSYKWTVQGFGFIRTKLADVGRIHVWDSQLTILRVSSIHSHPWPLRSTIISGELINQRFTEDPDALLSYRRSQIKTGEGGGLIGEPEDIKLRSGEVEFYVPGYTYVQRAEEIHRTIAQDGTVTLLERPQGPPHEVANVYWPNGTVWVTAEPRPAQEWEVLQAVEYALNRWNP